MTTPYEMVWRELVELRARQVTAQQVQVVGLDPLRVAGVDGDAPVSALGDYRASVGDTAWMLNTAVGPVLLGAVRSGLPPSPNGVIASAPGSGATTVAVTVDGQVESLPWLASYTPVAGHRVRIDWSPTADGGWSGCVLGRMGSVPVPKPPPSQEVVESSGGADQARSGMATLRAIGVGTWRSGGWRSDTTRVVQSTWTSQPASTGFWFYGPVPAELAGARVTRARVFLKALGGGPSGPSPVRLTHHSHARKYRSMPVLASSPFASPSLADNASGWFEGPDYRVAAQAFADGEWAGMAAVSSARAEYTTLAGLSGGQDERDPRTGMWDIYWERD